MIIIIQSYQEKQAINKLMQAIDQITIFCVIDGTRKRVKEKGRERESIGIRNKLTKSTHSIIHSFSLTN